MTDKSLRILGVVGAGNMGSGIAQKMATEGFDVFLIDVDDASVARGLGTIERTLAEAVDRGIMRSDRSAAIRQRIRASTRYEDLATADLVVEAVFENFALKQEVFRRLEAVCRPDTILATNTSSYLVSEIARATTHPERVLGLHYFFHPAKNRLVEVIAGAATDREHVRRAWVLQEQLAKTPIASGDASGFIVNRFFVMWILEAIRMLDEGVANAITIDDIAKRTFGVGMGPFELMNVSGIPIALNASTAIGKAFGPLYGPPERLRQQVESGPLWSLDGPVDKGIERTVAERLQAGVFLAAVALVDEGVGKSYDVDIGARVGLRWPQGPFEMMNQRGTAATRDLVSALASSWKMAVPQSLVEHGKTNEPFHIELVKSRPSNGVVTITINRPDVLNAINETVAAQLEGIFSHMARQPETTGFVLTGAGRSFVAGADIRFFIENIESGNIARIAKLTEELQALLRMIDSSNKPVVARVHGLALGGGVELALACDYIVATPGTKLGFPETGIGIYPGLGGTQRTTRRVGTGLAKWLVLTGQLISAEEALAIGLIDAVAPHDDMERTIAGLLARGPVAERRPGLPPASHRALAEFFDANDVEAIRLGRANAGGDERLEKAMKAVAANAPVALRLAAQLIDGGIRGGLDDGLRMELAHVQEIFATKDALAGLQSIGKPKPAFSGT
jgi:enoyl-CoA hydratase/3-hydroxyacyl-CoA dehydrogenase